MNRRSVLFRLGALTGALLSCGVLSQERYPSRTVTILAGVTPGQSGDILVRLVADRLKTSLQVPFVVENKPGASSAISLRTLAAAPPDGYTLGLAFAASMATLPHTMLKLGYDPFEFTPIVNVAGVAQVYVVPASSGVQSVAQLVQRAKKSPGEVNYSSVGTGSLSHLAIELLAQRAEISLNHVPYKGAPQALTDLLGGRIDLMADSLPGILPHVRSGAVRALAVTTATRQPQLPEVPTMQELGFPDFVVQNWMALLAPPRTPDAIAQKINDEVNEAIKDAAFVARLVDAGFVPIGGTRQALTEIARKDNARWGQVLERAGVKPA